MDAESIDGLALTARRAAQELVGVLGAVAVGLSHDGVGRGEVGVVVVLDHLTHAHGAGEGVARMHAQVPESGHGGDRR